VPDRDADAPTPVSRDEVTEASVREDAHWVTAIRAGQDAERCYEALVHKYWGVVVATLQLRLRGSRDADELTQDVFVKAFRSLDKLRTPRTFLAWLLRIAENRARDALRRKPRTTVSLDELLAGDRSRAAGPVEGALIGRATNGEAAHLEREEQLEAVLQAVAQLPEKYRAVIVLRYQAGLPAKEIAAQLAEPEGTIRARIFRGLRRVRRSLGAEYQESEETGKGLTPNGNQL
jgi:RNA polymerase sigma-70 factor (ECF subfamily)